MFDAIPFDRLAMAGGQEPLRASSYSACGRHAWGGRADRREDCPTCREDREAAYRRAAEYVAAEAAAFAAMPLFQPRPGAEVEEVVDWNSGDCRWVDAVQWVTANSGARIQPNGEVRTSASAYPLHTRTHRP